MIRISRINHLLTKNSLQRQSNFQLGSLSFSSVPTTETSRIPSRNTILTSLQSGTEYDLLIIGGGATGSGAALDAAKRGLTVACIEREDFASGTSSRSTKLIWGGSRYLVQAFVSLLSKNLILSPITTVKRFTEDFKMVLNCHRERTFLLKNQPHLTSWLPIAVPLSKWIQWPPPFGFPLASLGPLGLFPLFFKFYDALSGFSCPPSHVMTPSRARRKFPQLANNIIKYCSVFYEGIHDDARTNLAIAMTAAREGAVIANYCEAVRFLHARDDPNPDLSLPNRVVGAVVRDRVTDTDFVVRAKSVLFCGGPFTDELRQLEDPNAVRAVTGASGIHIVLPGYFAPASIGLVDMSTSDGRFLFFLPWNGHVLVGTTDHQCEPTMRPVPDESEILWLLNEASKYISPELQLRRQDVLSAWAGIRPLAKDPQAQSTAAVSRDHVVSYNPDTSVVFVSGGKWTTYREMAEDAVDRVVETCEALRSTTQRACETLTTDLVGLKGYSVNLERVLIQQYGVTVAVANRLASAYGGRAHDVLRIVSEQKSDPLSDDRNRLLSPRFPFLEAEVIFAVRHEWAVRAEDILARRTRLSFLNKDAALLAIPRVVELMGTELGWSSERRTLERQRCVKYMRHFGGSKPRSSISSSASSQHLRMTTSADLLDVFRKIIPHGAAPLDRSGLLLACEMLNYPLSEAAVDDCLSSESTTTDGTVSFEGLLSWWNSERFNPELVAMRRTKMAGPSTQGSGILFG